MTDFVNVEYEEKAVPDTQEEKKCSTSMKVYTIPLGRDLLKTAKKARQKQKRRNMFLFADTSLEDFLAKIVKSAHQGRTDMYISAREASFVEYFQKMFFYEFQCSSRSRCPSNLTWSSKFSSPIFEVFMYTPKNEHPPTKQKTFIWKQDARYHCIRQDGEFQVFDTLTDFYDSEW